MDFDTELNQLLIETFSRILKSEDRALKGIGGVDLSVSEFHLLEAVAQNSDQNTVSGLATHFGISLPSVSAAVKKLGNKGYVQKIKSDEDERSAHIALTEKGVEVDKHHQNFHRHMIAQITGQLNEDEKEILFKSVMKLNRFFKIAGTRTEK